MKRFLLLALLISGLLITTYSVNATQTTVHGLSSNSGLVVGVDYLAPNGSAALLTGFPMTAISTGGTGTTFPAAAAGNLVIFTSASTIGLVSAGTTTNCVWAVNGSGTLACYSRLAFDAPIIVGTASAPTGTGYTYYNQSTNVTTIGTGAATKTFAYTGNADKDSINLLLTTTTPTSVPVGIPYNATITGSDVICSATSTISVKWLVSAAGADSFSSISASDPSLISNSTYTTEDTTLTGWTTALTAKQRIRAAAPAMTTGPCRAILYVTKTN